MHGRRKKTYLGRNYTKITILFIVIAAILIVTVLYFSLGKALINIKPRVSVVSTDFIADVVNKEVQDNSSLLGDFQEVEVTKKSKFPATGVQAVEGGVIGKVTLINNTSSDQPLVKTTRLLSKSADVLLRLKSGTTVPAEGKVEVEVYADDPEVWEELPPTLFTIPGLGEDLQIKIFGESFSILKSKPDGIKVVSEKDFEKSEEMLTESLYKKAIDEFTQKMSNKDYVVIVLSKKVLDKKTEVEVGQQVDEFELELKLKLDIVALDQKKIIDLASGQLKQTISQEKELVGINLNNLSYLVQNYKEIEKTANIKVHVEGETVIKENNEILNPEKLAGLSPKGVELYLANFDEIEEVSVELSPFWVKKVPKMRDHVEIFIQKGE